MFKNFFKWGKKNKDNEKIDKAEEIEIEKEEVPLEEPIFEEECEVDEKHEMEEVSTFEGEYNAKDDVCEEIEYEIEEEQSEEIEEKKLNFFDKLFAGLDKTRKDFMNKIDGILSSYKKIDEELFEDLEEILVTADVGINTTMNIIDNLKIKVKNEKINDPQEVKELLKEEIMRIMTENIDSNLLDIKPFPAVILVVGVNGVGKTTTIGKLSYNLKKEGNKVIIAAGDTFRAAAIEQLEEWGNRSGVDIIAHKEGADPAAVIYDGIQAAKARKSDVLICDTAGRLHNKKNLMDELNKIFRVVEREYPEAKKKFY